MANNRVLPINAENYMKHMLNAHNAYAVIKINLNDSKNKSPEIHWLPILPMVEFIRFLKKMPREPRKNLTSHKLNKTISGF